MKKILLFILLFLLAPAVTMAATATFSDIDSKCIWSTYGLHNTTMDDKLILKHINGRITKTEWYLKYDEYIYMVANTFTDNYRFLGSYFMRYDCKEKTTEKLSGLLRWNIVWELWLISYDEWTNNIAINHIGSNNARAYWVYDQESWILRKVDFRKLKKPSGQYISVQPLLETYNGSSIELRVLYYTLSKNPNGGVNYNYTNYNNPAIIRYDF